MGRPVRSVLHSGTSKPLRAKVGSSLVHQDPGPSAGTSNLSLGITMWSWRSVVILLSPAVITRHCIRRTVTEVLVQFAVVPTVIVPGGNF